MKEWFDEYEGSTTVVMGISCVAMDMVHKCYLEGQTIKWSFYHDSTEELLVYFEGSGFDKEFEIKLMDIDTDTLEIPEMDYEVDMILNSHDWAKIIGQMDKFGDKTEIEMGVDEDNTVFIRTDGDMGKSTAKIKQEQLQEFAIEENIEIKIEFSTKFLLLMSEFESLNSVSNLHFSRDLPMKMCLNLDHWMEEENEEEEIKSYIKFYLAPCVNDDVEEYE
jgi:proliferating cell nuclear antigen